MSFIDTVMPYVQVLLPTIVVALIFWFVMKAIFNADRREREAEARADAEFAARVEASREAERGISTPGPTSTTSTTTSVSPAEPGERPTPEG